MRPIQGLILGVEKCETCSVGTKEIAGALNDHWDKRVRAELGGKLRADLL